MRPCPCPGRPERALFERDLKRILLVDDDADIQAVTALALIGLGGYTVEVCGSAREALARAPVFAPDLILLDVMMPGTDGIGALRAFRRLDATAGTPVVFLTAKTQPEEVEQYRALGCLGVIAKPFDPSNLPGTLETMWGRHVAATKETHRKEFDILRRTYAEELAEKIDAMQAVAGTLASGGWDRTTLESLYLIAHRLAGSSGLYKMENLSRAAGALEDILKRLLADAVWPPPSSPVQLTTLVKAVGQAARAEARRATEGAKT
jgi:CheY-like chemotaxis protein